jgi:hypothetical protein
MGGDWRLLIAPLAIGALLIAVLSFFYTAVWGTYTSSLWTLFFRNVARVQPAPAAAAGAYGGPSATMPGMQLPPEPPIPPQSMPPAPPAPPAVEPVAPPPPPPSDDA